jgi:hypothetical protein
MSATTAKGHVEAGGSETPRRPSEIAGLELDFDARCFPPEERVGAFNLLVGLKAVAGSVAEIGYVSEHVEDRARWRRLRDAAESEINAAVRRAVRLSAGEWQLPGSSDLSLLDRIDDYLGVLVP